MTVRVLFCDDSAGVIKGFFQHVAEPLAGRVEAATASSVSGVRQLVERGEAFDVVVTDLNFERVGGGPKDGIEVLKLARAHWPDVECILMTAYEGSLDVRDGQRLAALGVGEDALLAKTAEEDPGVTWLRLRERVQGIAGIAARAGGRQVGLRRENRYLRERLEEDSAEFVAARPLSAAAAAIRADARMHLLGMVGRSFAMQEVFRRVRRAAALPSDVLILGPTGTGKDLIARAIHALSSRAAGPFVKADLGMKSGTLVESELFGHEKGAFTGADARRSGLIAAAADGTFFLDEIGNVPPELQAKLLRVLEDRVFRPVGASQEVAARVRIVAATNTDLAAAVERGTFRADLYERLNVVRIEAPPLAERAEDGPLLVACFVADDRAAFGVPGLDRIDADAVARLAGEPWPRNVRQLKHAVDRLFAEAEPDAETITLAHVEQALEKPPAAAATGSAGSGAGVGAAVGTSAAELFREILAGRVSKTLAELKRKHGEDVVLDVIRRAMIHFRGMPDAEDCALYFGGSHQNAWRQFAFQHGLTWKSVRSGAPPESLP